MDTGLGKSHCKASISASSIGWGVLPKPTIWFTEGTFSTGNRNCGSRRQKTYPGKSGSLHGVLRGPDQFTALRVERKKLLVTL